MIDKVRLARQQKAFDKWRLAKAIGCILAVTGFGKTFIAILAIKFMNEKYPNRKAIVLIPNLNLSNDWLDKETGHIVKHNLKNVKVVVINTYIRYNAWECDLLIVDEVHRILNEDAQHFSKALEITKYNFIMCLTATLTKLQESFLVKHGIKIVDIIDENEAEKAGFIAPAITYNLGIELNELDKEFNEEINDKFKRYFAKFNHEFDLVKACNCGDNTFVTVRYKNGVYIGKKSGKEWREWFARQNGWTGDDAHPYSPINISKNAAQCMYVISQRKNKWQNFPSKIELCKQIINKFNLKTIVFSETSAFADKLKNELGDTALVYHSNLKSVAVKDNKLINVDGYSKDEKADLKQQGFQILGKGRLKTLAKLQFNDVNSKYKTLCTVKALDEGADFKRVEMLLFTAYSSVKRQHIQRSGRGRRIEFDNLEKKLIQVYLYMKGTQEEKWLRDGQRGKVGVRWINSIDEIGVDTSIKLTNDEKQGATIEVEADQIRAFSNNTESE
jgi:superfamily II DNA or RNA helicase